MTDQPRRHMKLVVVRSDGTRMALRLTELQTTHLNAFLYKGDKKKWAKFKVKLLK